MKCVFLTVAYNAEKTIARAMNSVLNQTYKDWIYYVVDNGSTDATNDIIKRYAKKNPKIKAYHVDVNDISTYVKFVKKILDQQLEAEGMCMLDADDAYVPDFLENAVKVMKDPDVDMVILGTKMLDAVSLEPKGVNVLSKSLKIDKENMGDLLPQIHWYFRQVWGKVWKVSVMRKYDISYDNRVWYGADTILVYQFLSYANAIYIMDKIGYQYYISPQSDSYTFNEKRVFSDQYLMKYTSEVLDKKCGGISENNWDFLYWVYYHSLKDTFRVVTHAKISNQKKIQAMHDMICNECCIELIKRIGENNQLFYDVAKELGQADILENDLTKNMAGETWAILGHYQNTMNEYSDAQRFELLQCIRGFCQGNVERVDQIIELIVWKCPMLHKIPAKQLVEFGEIVELMLNDDRIKCLEEILNVFFMQKDISDDVVEIVINLGMNLAVELEKKEAYLFLKKIQIQALIQLGKIKEALEQLDDWDIIFPEDNDFLNYRKILNENR